MGTGLYGIGISGIIANQTNLDLTGQNITNAGTPGYSRRVARLQDVTLNRQGAGVSVANILRLSDDFASRDIRLYNSEFNQLSTYFDFGTKIDDMLSNSPANINNQMQDFFTALQSSSNDPASTLNREVLMNQTGLLVDQFYNSAYNIDVKNNEMIQTVDAALQEVNTILDDISDINVLIKGAHDPDPSLLDKRDLLLEGLSSFIEFDTLEHDDGDIDVFIPGGHNVVLGGQSAKLGVAFNQSDSSQIDITLDNAFGSKSITDSITGGQIGGMLQYRNDMLNTARSELGRLAVTLANEFNTQNKLGMDLNGDIGQDIFKDINDPVTIANRFIANDNNTGNGQILVTIDDVSQLSASDYALDINGGSNYTLTRKSDNQVVASGTLGPTPFQISVDGLTVDLNSGSFNAGDDYLITPTRNSMSNFKLVTNDPSKFAMAMPIRTGAAMSNTGRGSISSGQVVDTTTSAFATPGQLSPPIRIEFLSPTSYQIVNATTSGTIEGPITYDPNADNIVFPTAGSFDPGYRVTLTGDADTGDQFNIDYNTAGVGDNRNGMLLAGIQNKTILDNGNSTIQQGYMQFASRVSAKTHFADISKDSSEIMLQQAQSRRDSVSGVNLDEEAANLVKYQQAYQASAQIIMIANSLFDTVIGIMNF